MKRRKKTEESESSEEGSDEERPRKRGRPRVTPRENIKGFTDQEVSYVTTVCIYRISLAYSLSGRFLGEHILES